MKWQYGVLEAGDHIRIKRAHYYHHGVYVGNDEVIHYTAAKDDGIGDAKSVLVRKTSLDFFAQNGAVEKAFYSHKELKNCRPKEEAVKIALAHLNEGGYNFFDNNCEDFANLCCYYQKTNTQMSKFRQSIDKLFHHD